MLENKLGAGAKVCSFIAIEEIGDFCEGNSENDGGIGKVYGQHSDPQEIYAIVYRVCAGAADHHGQCGALYCRGHGTRAGTS